MATVIEFVDLERKTEENARNLVIHLYLVSKFEY